MDEAVGENNRIDKYGGRKRLFINFTKNDILKYIGCILLVVTYEIKGHQIWGVTETYVSK